MKSFRVEFPGTSYAPVELPDLASLSLNLNVQNSPLLFGCRSGLCGTCLIEVDADDPLLPPDAEELETLDLYAAGNPRARLACQLVLSANVRIRTLRGS
jgi:ferredoxin